MSALSTGFDNTVDEMTNNDDWQDAMGELENELEDLNEELEEEVNDQE